MPDPLDDKDAIRAAARRQYADGSDNTIEVDDNGVVENTGDQTGFWVAAWVYVPKCDVKTTGDQPAA